MDSPAFSVGSIDFDKMTDEELDKYFETCEPLSNLPTPPPARNPPLPAGNISNSVPDMEEPSQSPEIEAYSTHLANLVPLHVSTTRPIALTIRGFLERADLPSEVVAFAACVLSALSSQFATSWRTAYVPATASSSTVFGIDKLRQPNVWPEVIVLAALALAEDFLQDRSRSNQHWAKVEARGLFTAAQIETSKMCIFQDLDYGLFRITANMVLRMAQSMQLASTLATPTSSTPKGTVDRDDRRPKLSLNLQGTAVWLHGVQTPGPSP